MCRKTEETEILALVNESEKISSGSNFDIDNMLVGMLIKKEDWPGTAKNILAVWKESREKQAVERMFFIFTDMPFRGFLDFVIKVEKSLSSLS